MQLEFEGKVFMKTELIILTGFLGSGKSTWLTKLLQQEKLRGRKTAVLMNELGDYSVDTAIVGEDVPLQELLRGCICCTLKDEVEIQLLNLYMLHQPEVIYIEATGVAHPMEIIDACMSPLIANQLEVAGVYQVVDAERWMHQHELPVAVRHLLKDQVRYADHVLLNKIDLVPENDVQEIEQELQHLNPAAQHYRATFADLHALSNKKRVQQVEPSASVFDVNKELHVRAVSYTFTHQIARQDFEEWLVHLPSGVFRVKGFVPFLDQKGPTLVQIAYGVPQYTEQEIRFPATLVLIGHRLDKAKLVHSLEQLEKAVI